MSMRGPMRQSHLRQVSAASLETLSTAHSHASQRDHNPTPDERNVRMSTGATRRQYTLWVHDETFSREEILFNPAAMGESGVQIGDVVEILPARASEDAVHASLKPDATPKVAWEAHTDLNHNTQSDSASKFKTPLQCRCLFVVRPLPQEVKARQPKLEVSVTSSVANTFGFKNRAQVFLSIVDREQCAASHVDIAFRDQYVVRADMWRLVMSELVDKIVYKGQKIVFMGSIKATVKNIFIREKKVLSGYFSPQTIPVFRSESAKYVLFIQMSREMWDFDSEGSGDILFSRVINGFLPELFKRWVNSDAKHLVTIVLFTRVEYDAASLADPNTQPQENLGSGPNGAPFRDFYRVVVNDMASGHWTTILDELKKNFRTFLRDVSILKTTEDSTIENDGTQNPSKSHSATIAGRPSTALRGNILEAIHLASAHLAYDHIDRDMVHTGTSIIVITPGSGVFEVSYESLASTTEALTNRGIAIDLVCLSPMPLHSVPLFKYREPTEVQPRIKKETSETPNLSPEIHHSVSSLVSRSSYLSPGSYLSATRMKERDHPRSKVWSYGIPHWLDISYWNPETYREARRILKNDPNAPIPFTVTRPSKAFTPRVRMYEIQMMGVMESEQSNISIPYLFESREMAKSRNSWLMTNPNMRQNSRSRFNNPSSLKARYSDSLRPGSYLENITDQSEIHKTEPHKNRRSVMNWMDQYDDNVFAAIPKRNHGQRPRYKRISEPDVQAVKAHERISARSVHGLREAKTGDGNNSLQAGPRRIDAVGSAVGSTVGSIKSPPSESPPAKKSALKTKQSLPSSRISRTISFALRGLSATPPRAQASTGLHAENANAMPMSNQRPGGTFSDTKSVTSLSASEGTSTHTIAEVSSRPSTPPKSLNEAQLTPSKPISIKPQQKKPSEPTEPPEAVRHQGSLYTSGREGIFNEDGRRDDHGRPSDHKIEIIVKNSSRDVSRGSPGKALAPWVRPVNPCNTPRDVLRQTSWFGRWQHAYPRPPHVAVVKWKSLKSPAVLPLTTEEFPTSSELASDYLQTPYRVFPNDETEGVEPPKTRGILLREMISLRLSHGFQIVVGRMVAESAGQPSLESLNVFDPRVLERDGVTVFLSKGHAIHRLITVDSGAVEVTRFTHHKSAVLSLPKNDNFTLYQPAMRTILRPEYKVRDIKLHSATEEYNWNYADNYVAGHRDYLQNPAKQLHFWRVRYVLIPMQLNSSSRRHLQSFTEDNEEEIHLLGITHLTQMWQRNKYVSPEEKRFDSLDKKRDMNPLNIIYQTRNPSEVVAAELDRVLLTDPGLDHPPAQLLPESELLEKSSVNLTSLAQKIQSDKGVRMMDRRWHWRLHYNCFIGVELTTWLVQNFRDIETRESAVAFGNELMKHNLFQHVEKRHNFRDGNYFYQICAEYRITRPESRGSWFPQLRADKSMPSTPALGTLKDSPTSLHARSDSTDSQTPQPPGTPAKTKNKVAIMLSKSMKYDVDVRKRSNRAEVVDLHYDRLHNPENCFHIELSWMSTTPKLIEDTIHSWASTADKYGLKLVQVPIAEACAIDKTQPFRKPYRIQLKVPPPKGPVHTVFNDASFAQPGPPDRHYYQKCMLRKFDFVLDFEESSAFPADVEASFSWGKPEYKYPQFIHRSGSLLVQITDEGDFLLLANRLVSTRTVASRDAGRFEHNRPEFRNRAATHDPIDRLSPRMSPLSRPLHDIGSPMSQAGPPVIDTANLYRAPEHILFALQDFCHDEALLEQFYKESHVRPASTKVDPAPSHFMDTSIPSLELPASVVSHHISPPPGLPSRITSEARDGRDHRDLLKSPESLRPRARGESLSYRNSPRSGNLRPLL